MLCVVMIVMVRYDNAKSSLGHLFPFAQKILRIIFTDTLYFKVKGEVNLYLNFKRIMSRDGQQF